VQRSVPNLIQMNRMVHKAMMQKKYQDDEILNQKRKKLKQRSQELIKLPRQIAEEKFYKT
jgi:hypothetical protein